MSRGAPKAPITYEGAHDPTRTYLPRQVATKSGTAYLSLATSTGVDPGTDPTVWLPLGGGGGGFRAGTGASSVIGGDLDSTAPATAAGDYGLAIGNGAQADGAGAAVAVGPFAQAMGDGGALAVGSTARATGFNATAIGDHSWASGSIGVAVGTEALAQADGATSIGSGASASDVGCVAVGNYADASMPEAVAVGHSASASGSRSIALGKGASCSVDDRAVIKANELQLDRSASTGTGTTLILRDTVTGTRMRVSVASGVLTVAAA